MVEENVVGLPSDLSGPGAPVYYSDGFAYFYERYYTWWVREFSPLLAAYLRDRVAEPSVLDLCCGTGESAGIFLDAGWRVTGVDLSRGMLGRARRKLAAQLDAGRLRLIESDATKFVVPDRVAACISMDGALNHLLSPRQVRASFARVSEALLPGGQFVFDLYEPPHFRRWHHISLMDEPDAVIIKRGVWDDETRFGMLRISGAFDEGAQCLRVDQNLRSRAYSYDEVEQWLAEAGLKLQEFDDIRVPECPCGHRAPTECHTVYRAVRG
jgi:SAM-dependent methyltransferase